MKHAIAKASLAVLLIAAPTGAAFAGDPHASGSASTVSPVEAFINLVTGSTLLGPDQTGQPGAECGDEDAPNTPGQSSTAPGSPFNEDGVAGTVYAGEQPQNSRNTASVSQYDAACLHVPAH